MTEEPEGKSDCLEVVRRTFNDLTLPITLNCMDVLKCVSLVAQMCLTLYGFMDCRLPGSSVHGISQARILEQVAISYSRGSSQPRDQNRILCVSCTDRWVLYHCALGSPWSILYINHSVIQLCPTLCDPMDYSMLGFPVHHQLPELAQTHVH